MNLVLPIYIGPIYRLLIQVVLRDDGLVLLGEDLLQVPRLDSLQQSWGVALRLVSVYILRGNGYRLQGDFGEGKWPVHFTETFAVERHI